MARFAKNINDDDIQTIKTKICPLVQKGELSLLLGAGFSYKNKSLKSEIPTGDGLRDELLRECGKSAGPRTTLKDAYLYASRHIKDFNTYLRDFFTVDQVKPWQEKIFQYIWKRIYTTNIDNVLNVAHDACLARGKVSGEFSFFNYADQASISGIIGSTPVVSIHGTIDNTAAGFVFSNFEYAIAANKRFDWHNELAARILIGGLVVIGNQLDESDIESYVSTRQDTYGAGASGARNWIVMPNPDPIKRENYVEAGYTVIDATAEEFFEVIYREVKPRKIVDLVLDEIPTIKSRFASAAAMSWFKEAFEPVLSAQEKASEETGILRHYITGAHPEWFYISNHAHAKTNRIGELSAKIAADMGEGDMGIGVLHVVGPSGSGKTTAIRSALSEIVEKYQYIYEYDSTNGIDINTFLSITSRFTEKSIFVFYSAAEFYYAVNAVFVESNEKGRPFSLFILEDRTNDYKTNLRHLADCTGNSSVFEFGELTFADARIICERIAGHALSFDGFSDLPIERQAGKLLDKERGYGGDLLSALYSLTTGENFETKIFKEYQSVTDPEASSILSVVATLSSLGFNVPINYLAGMLLLSVERITEHLNNGLSGIVTDFSSRGQLSCRHRVIADCYFENCIAHRGSRGQIIGILHDLSTRFTVEDIRHHPIPYLMYKKIISFNFLYGQYFAFSSREQSTEKTYHEAQKFFGKDGVFWLQFGRFYRKISRYDEAIDCFRTGLEFYESFQTRHSLGATLLAKYIDESFVDRALFIEGVELLETERLRRSSSDPYPTATLSELLIKVCLACPNDSLASTKLKECINYGLKHFREDEYFERQFKQYIKMRI